jgi:hypothetical protein
MHITKAGKNEILILGKSRQFIQGQHPLGNNTVKIATHSVHFANSACHSLSSLVYSFIRLSIPQEEKLVK